MVCNESCITIPYNWEKYPEQFITFFFVVVVTFDILLILEPTPQ